MNKLAAAMAAAPTGITGRRVADQAARCESYIVTALACGISAERAKDIFDEETMKGGDFDECLQRAKWRITSGEEPTRDLASA